MRLQLGIALAFAGLCGCGAAGEVAESDDVGERGNGIVGGQVDTGHPAVADLLMDIQGVVSKGTATCTGTLISPTVIVSAAHCVKLHDGYGLDMQIVKARAFFGTSTDQAKDADYVPIEKWVAHPKYDGAVDSPNDISVFVLSNPVSSVTPMPINETALTPTNVGITVTSVGFGRTSGAEASTAGTKRVVANTLTSLADDGAHFSYGKAGSTTCQGDSGGPELITVNGAETVAGVTSFGPSPCESGSGTAVRVDAHVDFLKQYLEGGGGDDSGGGKSGSCYDVFACMTACGGDTGCFATCQKPEGVDYCVP